MIANEPTVIEVKLITGPHKEKYNRAHTLEAFGDHKSPVIVCFQRFNDKYDIATRIRFFTSIN